MQFCLVYSNASSWNLCTECHESRCSAERHVYLTSIDYQINITGSLSPFLLYVSKNQAYMSIVGACDFCLMWWVILQFGV
jgi:hypothetical protein